MSYSTILMLISLLEIFYPRFGFVSTLHSVHKDQDMKIYARSTPASNLSRTILWHHKWNISHINPLCGHAGAHHVCVSENGSFFFFKQKLFFVPSCPNQTKFEETKCSFSPKPLPSLCMFGMCVQACMFINVIKPFGILAKSGDNCIV